MHTPQSIDDHLDLIDELIFEVEDVLSCVSDEGDEDWEFSDLQPVYQQLAAELKRLHAAVSERQHAFGDATDLPFMPLVRQHRERIPFTNLFEALNHSHLAGLRA